MQNIYIIGSGAIGKALSVCLKMVHKNVVLLRGSVDDGTEATEHIFVELINGGLLDAQVKVSTLSNYPVLDGLVVLTTKSFGNEKLANALRKRMGNSPLVILQNGLGVEQPFIDFPSVYRCVLFATSQLIENGVRFKPVAICPVGIVKGTPHELDEVVSLLNSLHFRFKSEGDIDRVSWKKAICNAAFNSICPLLHIDNGIFLRHDEALTMAKQVIAECLPVAKASGVILDTAEVLEALLAISKASDGQLISTLQDMIAKRPTEIDTLNFEIVRIAEKHNLGHTVPTTRLLGELTKLKSTLNR